MKKYHHVLYRPRFRQLLQCRPQLPQSAASATGLEVKSIKDGLLLKEFGSPKQVLAVRGPLDEQYRTLRFLDLRADVAPKGCRIPEGLIRGAELTEFFSVNWGACRELIKAESVLAEHLAQSENEQR